VSGSSDESEDIDSLWFEFGPEAFGKVHVECLCRGIGGGSRRTRNGGDRGEKDDASSSALTHQATEMVSELHGADAIQPDEAEGAFDRFVMETHCAMSCASVVDDKSDFKVRGRVGEPITHVVAGEIKGDWARLDRELRFQRCGKRCQRVGSPCDEYEIDSGSSDLS
jgi:hypothetical protein